jgi:GTP-binding protein LepA
MDTPGHVDFAYEVSRSPRRVRRLAAGRGREPGRRGADAGQRLSGDRRQPRDRARSSTRSTCPPPSRAREAADRGRDRPRRLDAVSISAKTGLGIDDVLEAIVTRLPPPKGDRDAPLKAHAGRQLVRRLSRRRRPGARHRRRAEEGQRSSMMQTGGALSVDRVGVFTPKQAIDVDELGPGESASSPPRSRKWPTRASATPSPTTASPRPKRCPASSRSAAGGVLRPVPGRRRRFRGPARRHGQAAPQRRQLHLRDGNLAALGFGFRCGFLGLLHLEIIQERLEPRVRPRPDRDRASVVYKHAHERRHVIELHNPADMPDVVRSTTSRSRGSRPRSHAGRISRRILKLCQDRRGIQKDLTYVGARAMVVYACR